MSTPAPSAPFRFVHEPPPAVVEHANRKPVKVKDMHGPGFNGQIAIWLTNGVGTMWCAYAFALLALVALPEAVHGGLLTIIQWISQTFIQLVMLSVIMVGQNILGAASDKRAEDTYKDAAATFALAHRIQLHLDLQDQHLAAQDDRLAEMVQALSVAFPIVAEHLARPATAEAKPQ